jgi:hypothetical protein
MIGDTPTDAGRRRRHGPGRQEAPHCLRERPCRAGTACDFKGEYKRRQVRTKRVGDTPTDTKCQRRRAGQICQSRDRFFPQRWVRHSTPDSSTWENLSLDLKIGPARCRWHVVASMVVACRCRTTYPAPSMQKKTADVCRQYLFVERRGWLT